MAQVDVIYEAVTYSVDNGVNKRGYRFNNPGSGSQRTFNIHEFRWNASLSEYLIVFKELDTDYANNYESPDHFQIKVSGSVDPSWINSGTLDLRALKIDALNQLFLKQLDIEPLNADGTVKIAYQ